MNIQYVCDFWKNYWKKKQIKIVWQTEIKTMISAIFKLNKTLKTVKKYMMKKKSLTSWAIYEFITQLCDYWQSLAVTDKLSAIIVNQLTIQLQSCNWFTMIVSDNDTVAWLLQLQIVITDFNYRLWLQIVVTDCDCKLWIASCELQIADLHIYVKIECKCAEC